MPENPEKGNRFVAEWEIPSKREGVDEKVQEIEKQLKALGWSEDEIGRFPEATSEALANAVIHGNLGLKMERGEDTESYRARIAEAEKEKGEKLKVRVKLELTSEEATITVYDAGGGSPGEWLPHGGEEDGLLGPSGRGITIMRAGCDKIAFLPGAVLLYKRRSASRQGKN